MIRQYYYDLLVKTNHFQDLKEQSMFLIFMAEQGFIHQKKMLQNVILH